MSCLSRVSSYTAAIFGRRTTQFIASNTSHQSCYSNRVCQASFGSGGKTVDLEFLLARFRVQCYSSKRLTSVKALRKSKAEVEKANVVEQEKDSFFVVRKGDVVGVYKNFSDCLAQVGSSVCDTPVSVYKGNFLSKESKEYLVSYGLQNALYTIRAADLKDDLFGNLAPCPIQEPKSEMCAEDVTERISVTDEYPGSKTMELVGLGSVLDDNFGKHTKLDNKDSSSCTLEFDGASKGNPGPAGAGVVLKNEYGSVICRLREGLGTATNNAAEYRALILGLKYALKEGYKKIHVRGDSKLVCNQVQGLWRARHESMSVLHKQAKILKDDFLSFEISHVLRALNSDADAQANLAVKLDDGEIEEEWL